MKEENKFKVREEIINEANEANDVKLDEEINLEEININDELNESFNLDEVNTEEELINKQEYKSKDIKPNRVYKDTLFKFIFGKQERKEYTLSLYNAINNSNYENVDDLTLVTLEDVLYISMKNDVAFILCDTINLYEQQSSYNPNMPLRMLLYLAKEYEKIISKNKYFLYSRNIIELPSPKLITFYNGIDDKEDIEILKLSDSYKRKEDIQVEVKVLVYNINKGRNTSLLNACKALYEYTYFNDSIRSLYPRFPLEESLDITLNNLPNDFIIKDLLIKERNSVMGLLATEFDEEEFKKGYSKVCYEDGVKDTKEEIAIKLYKSSNSLEYTAEITGLSIDKIKQIIKE